MGKFGKKAAIFLIILTGISLLYLQGTEFYEKKLIVVAAEARVHLDPDAGSPVLDVLKRGSIIYLASDRPFRKMWKYIYYTPSYSPMTKAGYILADTVRALFKKTKVYTLHGEQSQQVCVGNQRGHFRQIYWGMTPEEVVAVEGEPLFQVQKEGVRRLDFASTYGGVNGLLSYYFIDNQLAAAQFAVRTLPSKRSSWLKIYQTLKEVLTQEFGQAQGEVGLTDLMSDDSRSEEEIEVLPPDLKIESKWKSDQTKVLLRLAREGQDVSLEIRAQGTPDFGLARKSFSSLFYDLGKF